MGDQNRIYAMIRKSSIHVNSQVNYTGSYEPLV